jgi:hypothetical protein
MSHRADLNSLSPADRITLVNLILPYLTDAVVNAHTTITHQDIHIFTGHRAYIDGMEAYLLSQGGVQFVPLPKWDPANPIPPEFNVVKPQDNGTARAPMVNLNPNLPMPARFAYPAICGFSNGDALGNDVNGWHSNVHGTVGGTFGQFSIASAAPVFWCWHGFVDEIYYHSYHLCQTWQQIGHANDVVAMCAINNKIFGRTTDNRLWVRDPLPTDIPWQHIGHANDVVAMAAINNRIFGATSDNTLWVRDPILTDVDWLPIGHANNVVAMAATNGKLFCATSDNRLWMRDPLLIDVTWQHIGHANNLVAMTASSGKLFCATSDNKLWMRTPVAADVVWEHIGHANGVSGMTAINGQLFAATRDNQFWKRDLLPL